MNKSGFIANAVILLALAIIVAGVGGYLAFGWKAQAPQNNTFGWQTYTNSQYGLEFEYPSSWFVSEMDSKTASQIGAAWGVSVVDSQTAGKPDSDAPKNAVFFYPIGVNCVNKDWEVGFGNAEYKTACVSMENVEIVFSTNQNAKALEETIASTLSTFKPTSIVSSRSDVTKNEEIISLTPKVESICSYQSSLADSSYQNGLSYVADGENCAVLEPDNINAGPYTYVDSGKIKANGIETKDYSTVFLSGARFSPDGKHFAFIASNLNSGGRGDFYINLNGKFQRFVVSDGFDNPVYDDIYFPQYSQDGNHLGYCARKGDQYLKVIDGKETATTKDDYFATCDSLFGFKQGPEIKSGLQEYTSPDGNITIKAPGCASHPPSCFPVTVTFNSTNTSKEYTIGSQTKGGGNPAGYITFSVDSKHFAWLEGNQVYVDGNFNGKNYNEVLNLNFSPDSKFITYNARSGKTVYYIVESVN